MEFQNTTIYNKNHEELKVANICFYIFECLHSIQLWILALLLYYDFSEACPIEIWTPWRHSPVRLFKLKQEPIDVEPSRIPAGWHRVGFLAFITAGKDRGCAIMKYLREREASRHKAVRTGTSAWDNLVKGCE